MDLRVAESNLVELLRMPEEQFVVPPYQRPYSWGTEQVDELWNDILETIDSDHFMGSVVINDEVENKPEIIDGQQRLTTLALLIGHIRDEYARRDSKYTERVQGLLIADPFIEHGDDRFKLRVGDANWHVFRDFVLRSPGETGRKDWSDKGKLPTKVRRRNKELIDNAARLETLLRDYLREFDPADQGEALTRLERKVSRDLQFVAIRVDNVSDAFLLFETLNDRGLQLSAADLIKSRLLSEFQAKHGKAAVEEATKRWDAVIETLGRADVTRFLRHLLLLFYPKVQKSKVFNRFKRRLDETGPAEMLELLERMGTYYGEFHAPSRVDNATLREPLESLQDLRVSTAYVPLLAARDVLVDESKIAYLARMLEILTYRWTTIVGLNAQELETILQKSAASLWAKGKNGYDDALENLREAMPGSTEFIDRFVHKRMGTKYIANYTLIRLENAITPHSEKEIKSSRSVHLEHIMPSNLSEPWREALGPHADELHAEHVDRWGNITLLFGKLNQQIKDSGFDVKKDAYSENAEDDHGTDILLTKLLLKEDAWGPKEIEGRQRWMAAIADQLWSEDYLRDPTTLSVPEYPFRDEGELATETWELIERGESTHVEFKETGRLNKHTSDRDERLEFAAARSVAGFLNAEGGTLLIGIRDDRTVTGIDGELHLVKKNDLDGYELWLHDMLSTRLGDIAALQVRVRFPVLDGKHVCRIDCPESPKPIFTRPPKGDQGERFFVRVGNSTRELTGAGPSRLRTR